MKQLLIVSFLIINTFCFSQKKDTIYYNSDWKVTTKNDVEYYRPMPFKQKQGLFVVTDYYKNGNIQMQGLSTKAEKEVFVGTVKWFYPNGKIEVARNYIDGKIEVETISYFKDGKIRSKGIIKNSSFWQGTFQLTYNSTSKVQEYSKGSRIAKYSFYKDTKTIAEKQVIKNLDLVVSSIYFDRKGKKISEVFYKNRSGMYLEPLKGTYQYFEYDADNFVTKIIGKGEIIEDNSVRKIKTTLLKYPKTVFGTYKDGVPNKGYFYTKRGQLNHLKNGIKDGEVLCCFNNQKINTKGIYKDGREYNGTFLVSFGKKISSYKNGITHGKQQSYDDNFNLISQESYKTGIKEGVFIFKNEYTNEKHECIYKKGVPFNGDVYKYDVLETYVNGKKTQQVSYDYKTKKKTTLTVYDLKNKYKIDYIETFKDGKTSKLDYKDGSPFKGKKIEHFGFVTFNEGKYNGPYETATKGYKETGTYKNYNKHGNVIFQVKNLPTYNCEYIDGNPVTGTNYDALKKEIITYKNSKRDGFYGKLIKDYALYDSISGQYKKDKPYGTFTHYLKGKKITTGSFKKGKPYTGIFFDFRDFEKYKKGELLEKTNYKNYNDYKTYQQYAKGILIKEITTRLKNSKEIYNLTFKNKKPFNGKQFYKDSINNIYILTSYVSGMKTGKEIHYKYPFKNVIAEKNYINNKLEGVSTSSKKDSTYTCTYINNQPINGSFVKNTKEYSCVFNVKKGLLKTAKCYNGFYKVKNISSGNYKNGKPNEGLFLDKQKEVIYAKEYKKGIHIKTYINPYFSRIKSSAFVAHNTKTDTIKFKKNKVIIDYSNAKKTSGIAKLFYNNDSIFNQVVFKNNIITAANVTSETKDIESRITLENNKVVVSASFEDLYIKMFLPAKIESSLWLFLYDLSKYTRTLPAYTAKIYYKPTNIELSTLSLKNGKPYQGKTIYKPRRSKNDMYKVKTFKDGKRISEEEMTIENYIKAYLK